MHERCLDVSLLVKVKASLQIRVFGGSDWVHSPVNTPLNDTASTVSKGKDEIAALSVAKRVGFAIPPSSSSPASASSSSSSAVPSRANAALLKPSQEQRLRDLTDTHSSTSRDRERNRDRDGDSRGKKHGGIESDRVDAAGRPGGTLVPRCRAQLTLSLAPIPHPFHYIQFSVF